MNRIPVFLAVFGGLVLAAPTPEVAVTDASDLLGSTITITASFQNGSATETDVGYGPYLDVLLPTSPDPLTYNGATYLGQELDEHQIAFDSTGHAVHPFAVDGSGQPVIVTGPANGTLT